MLVNSPGMYSNWSMEWQNHLGWKRTQKSSSTINPGLQSPPLPGTTFTHFLNTSRSSDFTTSLGSFFQCLTTPSINNIFPDIHSKPPLAHLDAVPSLSVTCYFWEETNPHVAIVSFQAVVESNKVPPEPPFLQAKYPLLPQLLLTRFVL